MFIRHIASIMLLCCTALVQAQDEKTLFLISDTHLDTQWNWDVKTTMSQYIKNVLNENMARMDKYPEFMLNYEGAIKYMWMKELYPTEYERMKGFIQNGQWHVSGMSVDATDVMMSSAESLLHSMLYANRFYQKEFGVRGGRDIMLPDCFGFSYALPTLAVHAGQRGFHTAKLGWGSSAYDKLPPYGIWQGVDGSQIYAVYKPGAYDAHEDFNKDLTNDATFLKDINANQTNYGTPAVVRYVGPRGDRGGALQDKADTQGENTPYWLSTNVKKTTGQIKVRLVSPDDFFQYMADHDKGKYKVWNNELPMRVHGVGAYTSWGALKRWNRKNELMADAAEKASSVAQWLGVRPYPAQQLRDAWVRTIWQQHHDGLPGTSILSANDYSYNEYYLANRAFAQEMQTSAGAVIEHLDTQTEGTPIVVYNPLSFQRNDIVEGSIYMERPKTALRVLGPDGQEVLSQITRYDYATRRLHFIFAATVPSLGYAVYEARVGEKSTLTSDLTSEESSSLRKLSNGRYRISINNNGDISNLYDLTNSRTLINTAVRQQLIYDHEDTWPAWEISYTDVCRTPSNYVSGTAEIELVEDGPLRKAYRILRHTAGSTFLQYVRMNAINDRVECINEVDWQTQERMLKLNVPFAFTNANNTYDISLGTMTRGVRTSDEYEVCGHQWADHSNTTNRYGVSILSDCKYGWDKPNTSSLRLTLLHTPSCKNYSHQANMDLGPNQFAYALLPHEGGWGAYTQQEAGAFNQPLLAFEAPRHGGALGKQQAFISLSTDSVAIKAVKRAEDTDELIVRVYEWTGKEQSDVRLQFPASLISVREVNGIEEALDEEAAKAAGQLTTGSNSLSFSLRPYQPRTFAVRLQQPAVLSAPAETYLGTPVKFTCNVDLYSLDASRGSATSTYVYAYPAELIPDTLIADGTGFVMGPKTGSSYNALRCTGQTITLNRQEGENKLYLLLASPTEAGATVTVTAGQEEYKLEVPYFSGKVGEPLSCTTLRESYRKQNVVLATNHAHKISDKSNQPMQQLYIYKYGIVLPEGVETVTVSSSDRKTFLFAATTSRTQTDDIKPFTPLTTEIQYNELTPETNELDGRLVPKTVTASHQNGTSEAGTMANDQNVTTKWCVTSSQSQTPYLQYILKEESVIDRWMVLCAAREGGDYVAKSFKLQYQAADGTWVDADVVENNQTNKVIRQLAKPITASRVRLQMVQGEREGYTTRIYEFAVYGHLSSEDPDGIISPLSQPLPQGGEELYNLQGQRVSKGYNGIVIQDGRKVMTK